MPDKLTEFLRARKGPPPNREQRDEWLEAIEKLYDQIRAWLSEAMAEGLVDYKIGDTAITEGTLGTYDAPVLQLFFGERMVSVRPVGRFVVAAKGRIDMLLGPNKAMMVRDSDGTWKIIPVGSTRERPLPLTKDTFSEALEALLS
jgi:hypothetical protein